jgi:hypothetical protein
MLGMKVIAIKTGSPLPKHAEKSDLVMGQQRERYNARILTGPLPNIICMAVASNWDRVRTGTE